MKKVLVLPGWMTGYKLYKDSGHAFHVCIGKLDQQSNSADYIVGVSLGALVVLRDIDKSKSKIILINPPFPRRNFFVWFLQYLKYIANEGLFLERQHFTMNPIKFILELINCIKLLNTDFSKVLDTYREKITAIRGRSDRFFCDEQAVKFLRSKNIKIVEYDGGHNLSEELEKTMDSLMVY